MAPRGAYARRNGNQIMQQESSKVPADLLAEKVTSVEFRAPFQVLGLDMIIQGNKEANAYVNPNMDTMEISVKQTWGTKRQRSANWWVRFPETHYLCNLDTLSGVLRINNNISSAS